MSRTAFIRRNLTESRLTDKILYVTWTASTTKLWRGIGETTGRTTFRVTRDLYDMDDVGEIQDQIRSEGCPRDAEIVFTSVALTWWTLLELTQADRDATPPENR